MCLPALAALGPAMMGGGAAAGAMGTVAMAASIASAAVAGVSAYQSAKAEKSAFEYNAKMADIERERVVDKGDREQEAIGGRAAQMRGDQQAALAANGVDINYGSAAGVLAQTDYYGLQDQMTSERNKTDEDYSYRASAKNGRAKGSSISPGMAAGTSLLSSAGKVASSWYGMSGPAR